MAAREATHAFVGREKELDQVKAMLTRPIVYISGPEGIGKSRLAQEALLRYATAFDGTLWLECRSASDVLASAREVCEERGVDVADVSEEGIATALARATRDNLVVFDQIGRPGVDVSLYLSGSAGKRCVLVTQRAPVMMQDTIALGELPDSTCKDLLLRRAGGKLSRKSEHVLPLVQLCKGLPSNVCRVADILRAGRSVAKAAASLAAHKGKVDPAMRKAMTRKVVATACEDEAATPLVRLILRSCAWLGTRCISIPLILQPMCAFGSGSFLAYTANQVKEAVRVLRGMALLRADGTDAVQVHEDVQEAVRQDDTNDLQLSEVVLRFNNAFRAAFMSQDKASYPVAGKLFPHAVRLEALATAARVTPMAMTDLMMGMGDYYVEVENQLDVAETLFLRCATTYRSVAGQEFFYAHALLKLGHVKGKQGDMTSCVRLLERSIEVSAATNGARSFYHSSFLIETSMSWWQLGQRERCVQVTRKAVELVIDPKIVTNSRLTHGESAADLRRLIDIHRNGHLAHLLLELSLMRKTDEIGEEMARYANLTTTAEEGNLVVRLIKDWPLFQSGESIATYLVPVVKEAVKQQVRAYGALSVVVATSLLHASGMYGRAGLAEERETAVQSAARIIKYTGASVSGCRIIPPKQQT